MVLSISLFYFRSYVQKSVLLKSNIFCLTCPGDQNVIYGSKIGYGWVQHIPTHPNTSQIQHNKDEQTNVPFLFIAKHYCTWGNELGECPLATGAA